MQRRQITNQIKSTNAILLLYRSYASFFLLGVHFTTSMIEVDQHGIGCVCENITISYRYQDINVD